MSDMRRMHSIPNGRYSMEMRSGKLLDVDEGFTQLLGYTDEDIKNAFDTTTGQYSNSLCLM